MQHTWLSYPVLILITLCYSSWAFAETLRGSLVAPRKLTSVIVYLSPLGPTAETISATTHTISQQGRQFSPQLQIIKQGDIVVWVNDEERNIDHNIYSLSSIASFDLGLGESGSRLAHEFKPGSEGVINYFCSVHKNMEGKLIILPSPFFISVEAPGTFTLDDVPPGDWLLSAIVLHRRYRVIPQVINVQQNLSNLSIKVIKR